MDKEMLTAELTKHLVAAGMRQVFATSEPLFDRAATTIGLAFLEEGWTCLMAQGIPDVSDEERAAAVMAFERKELEDALSDCLVWTLDDGNGICKLILGDGSAPEEFNIVDWAKKCIPVDAFTPAQIQGLLAHLERIAPVSNFGWYAPYCPEGYIEVAALAVHPKARGRGHGTAILQALCSFADAKNISLVLECYKPGLVKMYGTFGFEVVDTLRAENVNVEEYCMVRPPAHGAP